jgi:hypothetical protein
MFLKVMKSRSYRAYYSLSLLRLNKADITCLSLTWGNLCGLKLS